VTNARRTIGVGRDLNGWHEHVLESIAAQDAAGVPVRAELVDLDAHDWIRRVAGIDTLIWNPQYMGPVSASLFKEKIFHLERNLGKRVMPNYGTVWHFESKVAQSYLFEDLAIPRPRTIVSFEYRDAVAAAAPLGLPLVAKKTFGSASTNVVLLRSAHQVERYLKRQFAQQLWDEQKARTGSPIRAAASSILTPWFREKAWRFLTAGERHGYAYLQEFITGNDADLRINVIGRRIIGFWRGNRRNDFRASGSGRLDLDRPIPIDAMTLCHETSRRLGADSLAYDILYRDGKPVVVEMSYNYVAEAVRRVKRHWVRETDGTFTAVDRNVWPQELWLMQLLEEMGLTPAG
jgi:glutathione synthase/RimK-type ligase-like ATP-grasp enzyme